MSSLTPLNRRVYNFVLLPPSGPEILAVKLIQLPLNNELQACCLLVSYIHIISESMGAQIHLAVLNGLAAMLMRLPLIANLEFSLSYSIISSL